MVLPVSVNIELNTPDNAVWIEGSDIHIEQLLDKLLDNTIDFAIRGTSIEISLSTMKNYCFIAVKNYGPTIAETELRGLFQLFNSRRNPGYTNNSEQHLGLGLYIARLICERHGGDLGVENISSGNGVVFTATLALTTFG